MTTTAAPPRRSAPPTAIAHQGTVPPVAGNGAGGVGVGRPLRHRVRVIYRAEERREGMPRVAASPPERSYWNSVLSCPAGGSCEFAMTVPLTAIVGVPMPCEPGWIGVFSVIAVT